MKTPTDLLDLLAKFGKTRTPLPSDLLRLVNYLKSKLEGLPAGASIDALKKPGAWFDVPLPANTESQPYYVTTPIDVEVVNVPAPILKADIKNYPVQADPLGSKITIPSPSAILSTPPAS